MRTTSKMCLDSSFPLRFPGVYIAHSTKEDVLCTLNFAPGKTVYGEKRISVDIPVFVRVSADL